MQVRTFSRGNPRTISPRVADAFFRVGQEAIANAVRHSGATELSISVCYDATTVRLIVEDNGRGFPAGEDSASFGIRGMGKRAESIGASLDLRSSPGNGTSVQLETPASIKTLPAVWQHYTSKT